MNEHDIELAIIACEKRILDLQQAKMDLDFAKQDLANDAAAQRADNAMRGRGLGGMLLGAKYRASERRSAASSNASLSRTVAEKRANITARKQQVQADIQAEKRKIAELKLALKQAKVEARQAAKSASTAERSPAVPEATTAAIDANDPALIKQRLQSLKAAYGAGALTAVEYETARIELLQPHLSS